ncbi:MAG: hypothetical protein ACKKMO_01115 [Candidatus Nealsonbacteria bacterium]
MIKNKCEHEWKKHTSAGRQQDVGTISATFMCEKCRTEMTASEVFQLEALENQTKAVKHLIGFQKWIWIFSVSLSALAIIIAFLTFLFK